MKEISISENAKILLADPKQENEYAVIAFAGAALEMGIPAFEFIKILGSLKINSLFIKDISKKWYQENIPDLGSNPKEISNSITSIIDEYFPGQKIMTIGNSMGGYAAIMFACLCNFEKALAFCPTTFIGYESRKKYSDNRFNNLIQNINHPFIEDLLPLLTNNSHIETFIYYGEKDYFDILHAERLSKLINVQMVSLSNCDHDAVKWLREKGYLSQILKHLLSRNQSILDIPIEQSLSHKINKKLNKLKFLLKKIKYKIT